MDCLIKKISVTIALLLIIGSVPTLTIADTTTSTVTVTNTTGNAAGVETSGNPTPNTTITKSTTTTSVVNIDDKIVQMIYAKYAKDSALIGTNLTVTSANGVVNISGNVTMTSQKEAAVSDAKSVAGVKAVTSSINVITDQTNTHQPQTPNY